MPFSLTKLMKPITEEQVIAFLKQYQAPTADLLGLDYNDVISYLHSGIDLNLLTLLAKAEKQGLDLVFVHREKVATKTYQDLPQHWLDEPKPWRGARYVGIDLSLIMHDGYSFIYKGILESMGLDIELNTLVMIGAAVEHFEQKDDLAWMDGQVKTLSDLVLYLNGGLRPVEPTKTFKSTIRNIKGKVQNSLFLMIVMILVWVPWQLMKAIFKPIYIFIKELIEEQNKPLGYRRDK